MIENKPLTEILTDWRLKMFKIVKREEMSEGNVILNEIEALFH